MKVRTVFNFISKLEFGYEYFDFLDLPLFDNKKCDKKSELLIKNFLNELPAKDSDILALKYGLYNDIICTSKVVADGSNTTIGIVQSIISKVKHNIWKSEYLQELLEKIVKIEIINFLKICHSDTLFNLFVDEPCSSSFDTIRNDIYIQNRIHLGFPTKEYWETRLKDTYLDTRYINALKKNGINKLYQFLDLTGKELVELDNISQYSAIQIIYFFKQSEEKIFKTPVYLYANLKVLNLEYGLYNALYRNGIRNIGDLIVARKNKISMRRIGEKSIKKIDEALSKYLTINEKNYNM